MFGRIVRINRRGSTIGVGNIHVLCDTVNRWTEMLETNIEEPFSLRVKVPDGRLVLFVCKKLFYLRSHIRLCNVKVWILLLLYVTRYTRNRTVLWHWYHCILCSYSTVYESVIYVRNTVHIKKLIYDPHTVIILQLTFLYVIIVNSITSFTIIITMNLSK